MDADRMPGDAEAAGAIAGMQETYGCEVPRVGRRIAYRLRTHTESECESGVVLRHADSDGRPLLVVEPEDEPGVVRVIDAREWPTGNVLPF